MKGWVRRSLAARLLAGSLAIITAAVAGVSAYLLIAFDRQTRDTATSTADERATALVQLLNNISGATAAAVVSQIAGQASLATALADPDPGGAVARLIPNPAIVSPQHHYLVVLGTDGHVILNGLPKTFPAPTPTLPSVVAAIGASGPALGVELIGPPGGQVATIDAAQKVTAPGGVELVGIVLDVAPLLEQLRVIGPAIGPTSDDVISFIPVVAGLTPSQQVRVIGTGAVPVPGVTPPEVIDGISGGGDKTTGTWEAPLGGGGTGEVAGSFVRVVNARGGTTGYVGVETPIALFTGNLRREEATLGLIALFVLLLTAILVILFVDRFVRQPVARLERGVARIAGGDYATAVPVEGADELGRLAGAVNVMREQIQADVTEIERGRARIDAAVEHLGRVSRALTTTGSGVDALEAAVVRAAAAIEGVPCAAVLYRRDADRLVPTAAWGVDGLPLLEAWNVTEELCGGRGVRVEGAPPGWSAGGLLAVPMFYQDAVVGALAVMTAAGSLPADGDEQSLSVLANNAAIAVENTRLFEQERETVRRLRELDTMKSDFLATVQHELRTPLTAIMGMSDLLEMCWDGWGDPEKLEAVRDVQRSSKSLYDIVETIIDFSLLERDTLGLHPHAVRVRPAVDDALQSIRERTKGDLDVDVDVQVPPDTTVYADPERFRQVVRAILDNATKFTRVPSHVRVRTHDDGDGRIRLDVVDNGIGIPEEALPRIFDRFYQVDNSATRSHGGTGMGLALVKRLVDAHGAAVEVESAVGRGSRFTLVWPATAAAAGGELASQNGHVDGLDPTA